MEKMHAKIKSVIKNSIADEIELEPGDCILKINDTEIKDVLDYRFFTADDFYVLEVLKKDGNREIIEVESGYEDLGVEFENSLMDNAMHCKNKCVFCFIDQLPRGMRKSLYFKDDDARLSFLQGNYITLTNLTENDIERIIKMRISPVNVSVHTTDPDLRRFMLKNKNAGKLYGIMQRFYENKITMNCQIVLCPNINDKENLKKTVYDLAALHPYVHSVSIVPVGRSAHRERLCKLEGFNKESAAEVIKEAQKWQNEFLKEKGSRIIYLSDEFYIMAGEKMPEEEEYEGYAQIENGVGLITSMKREFDFAIKQIEKCEKKRHVSIATGEIAYDFIKSLTDTLHEKFENFSCSVYKIKNNFFGGDVSVTGLICGVDLIEQLKEKDLGEELCISESMLRDGDDVFLDDYTLDEVCEKLNTKIVCVENDGYDFVYKMLDIHD